MINRVELELNDKSYTVTPTFRVIEAWEDRINIHGVAGDILKGKPRYRDMAWVVYAAIRFGKENDDPEGPQYSTVGEWVVEHLEQAVRACNDLISSALIAGSDETKPAKKTEPTPE